MHGEERVVSWPRAAAVALVFAAAACGPYRAGLAPAGEPGARVAVEVANGAWADIVVYVADGSTPRRLGHVPALGRARWLVPVVPGTLRLLVRPIGSTEGFALDPIFVGPEQGVELSVHPDVERSFAVAR